MYHDLTQEQIQSLNTLIDFKSTGSRELTAEDYVYQIKRLAHPKMQSPIAEIMKNYIVGFDDFSKQARDKPKTDIKNMPMAGVRSSTVINIAYGLKANIRNLYFGWQCHFLPPCLGRRMCFMIRGA